MNDATREIILEDGSPEPLRFVGERLVRSSGFVERGLTIGFNRRWHDIELYRRDDGGYALLIVYLSKHGGEEGHRLAVRCADDEEVYRVLRQYELRLVDGLVGKGVPEKHAIALLEKFRKQERDVLRVVA